MTLDLDAIRARWAWRIARAERLLASYDLDAQRPDPDALDIRDLLAACDEKDAEIERLRAAIVTAKAHGIEWAQFDGEGWYEERGVS